MDKSDGRNNAGRFWRVSSSDSDFENTAYSDSNGDSSVENSPFRGFEKEPKVLIEKFDIEPFLKKPRLKRKKNMGKSLNGIYNTLPQLVSNCYVKLAREDLKQLQKDVLENSRLNKLKTKGILRMPLLHCKICAKVYSSEKNLQNHLENKHVLIYKAEFTGKRQKCVSFSDDVIVYELKEYHKCRKCTKIFEQYQSLKTHMKHEHKKRKCYICHYCSKNFVDRMFFKVHIRHHCDVCGLLLPNKRKYLTHRRDTCRVKKKYTCKTCENSFFSYMDLKDHSYDHLDDLFVCDICKEQHSSICAVSHHILFLHANKRPKELYTNRNLGTEKLYLCNFCEASSIDKDVIDKHVSVLPDLNNKKRTGYMDYYFCDQCLGKFDTETSMLQHKWSHFLNTSETSQVQSDTEIRQNSPPAKSRRTFEVNENLPNLMQPKIVLERIDYIQQRNSLNLIDSSNVNIDSEEKNGDQRKENTNIDTTLDNEVGSIAKEGLVDPNLEEVVATGLAVTDVPTAQNEVSVVVKKAIVDPKSKKTLISRFQCLKCLKYYSNNYCLNRHMLSVHQVNLQCHVCEEIFVWPSLLKTHKCIRTNIPEMPFDDARPEIQFDNYRTFGQAGIDDLMNISESEDYMNAVDFEIPAPIVELTEYENTNARRINQNSNYGIPVHNSYKIIMQEVPIEF